jgi:hypothetical protein
LASNGADDRADSAGTALPVEEEAS